MSGPGIGVYIHWPYCARICPYCDFNVYRAGGRDSAALIAAIVADIKAHRARIGARRADTIFFGGGSPSLLAPDEIATLIGAVAHSFDLASDAEITLEANPEDRAKFADFAAAGINRLSIGVQALRDDALKMLGRNHDAAGARAAVEAAAQTGARVSIDMIYARAGQTADEWRTELEAALALPAEHFSLYELTIKPGTAFERAVHRGVLTPPGDEAAALLYEITQDICDAAGAPAYEISNHARTLDARSRHNLIYWRGGEWLGVGPGAHGRINFDGARWASEAAATPAAYIAAVSANAKGWSKAEKLSEADCAHETLIMGLRAEGAPRAMVHAEKAPALEREGLIAIGEDRVSLTRAGRLLADRIAAELAL
ncbi:MAG: radical SAM family heme chaperone HemW [Pseudomonadota bacterium]